MTNLAPATLELEPSGFAGTYASGLEAACQSNLRSVNALLDHVRGHGHDFEALFGRILANWHEYLALRFQLLGEATRRTRELAALWASARGQIADRAELRCVDEHVADLVSLDPDAMALRYVPEVEADRRIPEWLRDHVDLAYVVIEVSSILEVAQARSSQRDQLPAAAS